MPHIDSQRKVFQPSGSEPAIMTLSETIDWLRTNRTTLYRVISRGEIPCFRVGKVYRFFVRDLEQWVARQENERRNPS